MAETPEQTKARHKTKDEEYARNARLSKWPMFECRACVRYACIKCSYWTPETLTPAVKCPQCASALQQTLVCCKRVGHHVGDCCTHCGNDERKL
jgi:hypothetical protein